MANRIRTIVRTAEIGQAKHQKRNEEIQGGHLGLSPFFDAQQFVACKAAVNFGCGKRMVSFGNG
jgi:hypothetical protein